MKDIFTKERMDYLDELYQDWQKDPTSLPREWHYFFSGFELSGQKGLGGQSNKASYEKQQAVGQLIQHYRNKGYLLAKIDPLGKILSGLAEFSLDYYGLSEADLGASFEVSDIPGPAQRTLQDIITLLQATYCGTLAVEYEHLPVRAMRFWLQKRLETVGNQPDWPAEKKLRIFSSLMAAEEFEHFLHTRFIGQKRFSGEGAESIVPGLWAVLDRIADLGYQEMVVGMAHRGRLTILANVFEMPPAEIFAMFQDKARPELFGASGDVKYHKGYVNSVQTKNGQTIRLTLVDNPSHLEAVNGVVEGVTRARQHILGDLQERNKVLPVLIHGDSAVTGQGIVQETLNMAQLKGYRTGGTLHIIINNQIGFTTSPVEMRTMCYPSDVTKMVPMPIFRVNGDDPEAIVQAAELAIDFRHRYRQDVVIELYCYRRHGHNEGDEPAFTQPKMYEFIQKLPTTRVQYRDRLRQAGILPPEKEEEFLRPYLNRLQAAHELAKNQELAVGVPPGIGMTPLQNRFSHDPIETQFDLDRLTEIARLITTIPCKLNPKLQKIIDSRYQNFMEQRIVDWSFAESLAFGSLLQEGVKVRLSGEDSKRGTFAQRHAAVYDIETDAEYIPLNSVVPGQSPFCVHSSPLSEYAVLGFEYGYSISRPDMLVIWEAQFGDFINTSQVIVDQFIIAGESKWLKPCRLVLLLPHGYEGQGPEHSSSYLERFLQLGAEENIQICAPTSPAQYFHLLRRQMKAPYIKPLVIMGPKSMLRNRLAISTVEELAESSFQEMVDDNFVLRENTTRLIFCTGKIYYDLHEYRLQHNIKDSAIIRIEQLYPFHEARLREILASYPAKTEMIWVQEEPRNRGAWFYISDLFNSIAGYGKLDYTGRKKSASPATGSLRLHKQEQQTIIEYAFKRS